MVELFVMMVLVITLLKLFVEKWASPTDLAGEVEISGVRSNLLSKLHLMTFIVEAENGAHVPTTLKTTVVTPRTYSLLVTEPVSLHYQETMNVSQKLWMSRNGNLYFPSSLEVESIQILAHLGGESKTVVRICVPNWFRKKRILAIMLSQFKYRGKRKCFAVLESLILIDFSQWWIQ